MQKHLVEIKARTSAHEFLRRTLREAGAVFHGTDHQIDRYFKVESGRLKLRSGNIENSLIYYQRPDQAGPKDSSVALTVLPDRKTGEALSHTLTQALGNWVTVDKQREIYFIENVKFHLDTVAGLGTFVEIEAIGDTPDEHEALLEQVKTYLQLLNIESADLITNSYSDLLSNS